MKILMIRQPTNFSFPILSFSTGIVATLLHNAGHKVKVIDNNSVYRYYEDRHFVDIARKFQPDIIAFNITIVNALQSYKLLNKLKTVFKDTLFIAGGMHAKGCFKEILNQGFDLVVNREAETLIVPLINFLEGKTRTNYKEGLESIPGVSFIKEDGRIHEASDYPMIPDLDDVPFVNYDLFNLKDFFKTGKEPAVTLINGQRGCPFRCTFCSDEALRADKRLASAEYMVNYIGYLYKNYHARYIWIADNNFLIPRNRAIEFCERMISSGLNKKVSLVIQSKVEGATDDRILDLLKKAGCTKIGFGIERLEPYSQDMVKKKTSLERVHQIFSLVQKHRININVNILVGFPFETVELLKKERDLFLSLMKYVQNFSVAILTPVPGTTYYDNYPKVKEWYLNPKTIYLSRTYYGHALDLNMIDVIDTNFFELPSEVVKELKNFFLKFKHLNHGKYVVNQAIMVRCIAKIDRLIAYLSKITYTMSPEIEFYLFRRVKSLRYYFATLLFGDKVAS